MCTLTCVCSIYQHGYLHILMGKRLFYSCIRAKILLWPVVDWTIINVFLPIYLPGEN